MLGVQQLKVYLQETKQAERQKNSSSQIKDVAT